MIIFISFIQLLLHTLCNSITLATGILDVYENIFILISKLDGTGID